MRYAIHPVWSTATSPQQLRYGLYVVGPKGEEEVIRSVSLDIVEEVRRRLLLRECLGKLCPYA